MRVTLGCLKPGDTGEDIEVDPEVHCKAVPRRNEKGTVNYSKNPDGTTCAPFENAQMDPDGFYYLGCSVVFSEKLARPYLEAWLAQACPDCPLRPHFEKGENQESSGV